MLYKPYVLITAARNEQAYIEKTIISVINQSILPKKWIIVSDGSTDRTDQIVKKYVKQYHFIQHFIVNGDAKRNFGSMVRAFNTGHEQLKYIDYEFIGNLDADISIESDYYQSILEKFQENTRLGLAGGFIYEQHNGKYESRKFNSNKSVPHAIQLFRRECFESIGGYIPLKYGGVDWCAEVMARMNGWHVESFPEIKVLHHRRTLAAEGVLKGAFRQGLMDFSVGSHPLFEVFKCMSRVRGKPFLIYAVLRLTGFIWACYRRENREVSSKFVMYLRREQMQRVYNLFLKNFCHKFAKNNT